VPGAIAFKPEAAASKAIASEQGTRMANQRPKRRTLREVFDSAAHGQIAVEIIVSPYLVGAKSAALCEKTVYLSQAMLDLIDDANAQDRKDGTPSVNLFRLLDQIPLTEVTLPGLSDVHPALSRL
jgi:hypothetical protein